MGRMEISHEDAKELIVPYVLGALGSEEVPFVRAHILSCDECMAEADSYSEVAAKVALSVEPEPLSPGFADRVLSAARGDSPEQVTQRGVGWSRWAGRIKLVPALGSLAALIAIAVLSISLIQARNQLGTYQHVVSAVLRSDSGVELNGSGAVAKIVPDSDGSVFVASGMQEAPDNHTYELWLIEDGTPVSAGTFDVNQGDVVFESDLPLEGVEGVAVTVEPEGGSPTGQPTSDPIMASA